MNDVLASLTESALASRVGWVLIHFFWQGAAIAALFEIARLSLRRHSANARYAAGCCAMALLLAAPIVTLLVQTPTIVAPAENEVAGSRAPVELQYDTSAGPFGSPGRNGDFLTGLTPWLTAAWMIGVVIFSFRLLRSWWWVGRIRTGDCEPVDAVLVRKLNALRERLGVSEPVRLVKSALVQVPTLVGWLRPVILLPASTVAGLSPAQLEAILAHELAHVRRWDYLVNAFQCVIETLLFYHPAVWWISRCIREERENCCDDLVVRICGDRVGYARALAELETLRMDGVPVALAATDGSLLRRVRRLLGVRDDRPAGVRRAGGAVLLLAGVVLVSCGVFLKLSPPLYEARARLKLEQPYPSQTDDAKGRYDPHYIETEIAVIGSELILRMVIENLDLQKQWGTEDQPVDSTRALNRLRRAMRVAPVRSSAIVEIRVRMGDPEQAAAIANETANVYKNFRIKRWSEMLEQKIEVLHQASTEYTARIREARKEAEQLRATMGSDDAMRALQNQLVLLRDSHVQLESQLTLLRNMDKKRLREAIDSVVGPDERLTGLLKDLQAAEQALRLLSRDYSGEHPILVSAKRTVEDLNDKADERVRGVLTGLETKLKTTEHRIEELVRHMDAGRSSGTDRSYEAAMEKVAALEKAQAELGSQLASAETDIRLPRPSELTITDTAAVPERPVSGGGQMALAAVISGIALILAGGLMMRKPADSLPETA